MARSAWPLLFIPAVAIFVVLVNEECILSKGGREQICYERSEFQFCCVVVRWWAE